MEPTRRGILLLLLSLVCFVSLDSLAKHLTGTYPPLEVVWARYTFAFLMVPLIVPPRRLRRAVKANRPRLQLLRSALLIVATFLFFTSLKYAPLADVVAVGFVAPLLTTAAAIPILGEKVGARRWTAILIGLIGALIVIRPGLEVRHWAYFLPLGVAAAIAFYNVLTRLLARHDSSDTTFFYTSVVGVITMSAVVPFVWTTPAPVDWLLMAGAGACGMTGHWLLILAYRLAPVSLLAPYSFCHIVLAVVYGIVLFGEIPDWGTLIGSAVIAGSGLYVFHRETWIKGRADPG